MALKTMISSNTIRVLNLNLVSNFKRTPQFFKSRLSTFTPMYNKDEPVKFTTNKASSVKFSEALEYGNKQRNDRPKYQHLVIALSLSTFLIYFCIIREENDIDEALKGNPEYVSDMNKLLDLQFKLGYCQKNNLPTGALIEKIEALKEKIEKHK